MIIQTSENFGGEEHIHNTRGEAEEFKNIAALWSMGKDSTAMLAVARKAFLGKVPFPVIHIDNGIKFRKLMHSGRSSPITGALDLIVGKTKITPARWGCLLRRAKDSRT